MTEYRQADIETPHFSLPFRFGGINGGVVLNEQDSENDIVDCIKCIIAYPEGSRADEPEFGIPDLLFKQRSSDSLALLQEAILAWEPRSSPSTVEEREDWDEFVNNFLVIISTVGED